MTEAASTTQTDARQRAQAARERAQEEVWGKDAVCLNDELFFGQVSNDFHNYHVTSCNSIGDSSFIPGIHGIMFSIGYQEMNHKYARHGTSHISVGILDINAGNKVIFADKTGGRSVHIIACEKGSIVTTKVSHDFINWSDTTVRAYASCNICGSDIFSVSCPFCGAIGVDIVKNMREYLGLTKLRLFNVLSEINIPE